MDVTEREIKHFGVLGMRWGIRRESKIATSERARVVKLVSKGHVKEAKAAEKSAQVHEAKAKNIQRKLDNYHKFQNELKSLKKSGKENDLDAVLSVAKKHDKREAAREADFKKAPKFSFKEKLYRSTLGDPAIPMGQKLALSALFTAGSIGVAYLSTRN